MTFSGTLVCRVLLVGTLIATSLSAAADDTIFDIQELTVQCRVVTASFTNFDGDRQKDLVIVSLEGIPPLVPQIGMVSACRPLVSKWHK